VNEKNNLTRLRAANIYLIEYQPEPVIVQSRLKTLSREFCGIVKRGNIILPLTFLSMRPGDVAVIGTDEIEPQEQIVVG
jgi:hypothetical protein